jgi:hypothetical protein
MNNLGYANMVLFDVQTIKDDAVIEGFEREFEWLEFDGEGSLVDGKFDEKFDERRKNERFRKSRRNLRKIGFIEDTQATKNFSLHNWKDFLYKDVSKNLDIDSSR